MKQNICFLLGSYQTGGAENHVLQILKNLDYSKFNPCVAVMRDDGGFDQKFKELGLEIYIAKASENKLKKKLFGIFRILSFVKFLKRQNIDILHIHLTGCYMFGMYSAYLAGVSKKIITWHNMYDNSVRSWNTLDKTFTNVKGFFQVKTASFLANTIIAVSEIVKVKNCKYFRIKSEKVTVVYNGINSDNFKSKRLKKNYNNKSNFIIGAVGALQHQKDYITMINVINKVSIKFPNVILRIMGEGPERKNIENHIKKLKLEKHVELNGIVKDIPSVLRELDLFLMTSLWEGFSIALLEAMATGLPIVATSVGGNSEAILDGQTGLLVPSKDVSRIQIALEKIITNPTTAENYGKAASERFNNNYTIDAMMLNLENVFSA
jgi:L-malate glycosyltransferase